MKNEIDEEMCLSVKSKDEISLKEAFIALLGNSAFVYLVLSISTLFFVISGV